MYTKLSLLALLGAASARPQAAPPSYVVDSERHHHINIQRPSHHELSWHDRIYDIHVALHREWHDRNPHALGRHLHQHEPHNFRLGLDYQLKPHNLCLGELDFKQHAAPDRVLHLVVQCKRAAPDRVFWFVVQFAFRTCLPDFEQHCFFLDFDKESSWIPDRELFKQHAAPDRVLWFVVQFAFRTSLPDFEQLWRFFLDLDKKSSWLPDRELFKQHAASDRVLWFVVQFAFRTCLPDFFEQHWHFFLDLDKESSWLPDRKLFAQLLQLSVGASLPDQ
ncbi:hypothetical protein LTR08_006283 [Meristemomyces frigidus]|nr:hypothetical protein LTR08_006283 [Meristemomyces frigidus]